MSTDDKPPGARFGPYEADFSEGILRRHGKRLKIQAKPLAILELLVRKPGSLVSREELKKALWPKDVFVDFDKNLATAVNKLRAVLDDSADSPRFIETVPRRGYRFLARVEVVAAPQAAAPASQRPSPTNPLPGRKNDGHLLRSTGFSGLAREWAARR